MAGAAVAKGLAAVDAPQPAEEADCSAKMEAAPLKLVVAKIMVTKTAALAVAAAATVVAIAGLVQAVVAVEVVLAAAV